MYNNFNTRYFPCASCNGWWHSLSDMEANIINNLVAENKKLQAKCEDLEDINSKLCNRVAKLEKTYWQNDQYQRRNNVEISGIPSTVENVDLEEKVCDIFKSIDVCVESNDFEACHRLPYSRNENRDMPQRTIVRLVNRKTCESALKNRKKLKESNKIALGFPEDTKLFINDSLCPYYRVLYGKCKKLYKNGDIVNFWTYNGMVTIRIRENGNFTNILHENDLFKLFPNVDFEKLFQVKNTIDPNE